MEIDESLQPSNWDGKLSHRVVLLASTEPWNGREIATEVERILNSLNMSGATGPDTSPVYHQTLIGIEGWKLDLKERTYTRVDSYMLSELKRQHYPTASMKQIETFLKDHRGQVTSLMYEL